jgi:hypothetical protein
MPESIAVRGSLMTAELVTTRKLRQGKFLAVTMIGCVMVPRRSVFGLVCASVPFALLTRRFGSRFLEQFFVSPFPFFVMNLRTWWTVASR